MASYNTTRYVEELLERTESLSPSFTIHLHLEYWTLNNGSKFLYNNQIASLLDDVRAHRIPVDFLDLFDAAKVPFYDGCMIVELLDYRPQRNKEPTPEKPERSRAVLHPNSETLWADICSLNQRNGGKWTDLEALDIEARILLATSPPLCLEPDSHLTRIANHVLRVSTPTVPVSLKRKAAALDTTEADESEKVRRGKIMQFMNPRPNRAHTPSYRILDVVQKYRQANGGSGQPPLQPPQSILQAAPTNNQYTSTSSASSPIKPPTPSITVSQADSSAESDDKKTKQKKAGAPQSTLATTGYSKANGSTTSVPPNQIHFINQNPINASQSSTSHSTLQPQVYPSVQAATEAAKRAPTPATAKQYPQSPPSQTPVPQGTPQPQATSVFQQQSQAANPHFLAAPLPTQNGATKATAQRITPTPQQQLQHQAQLQAQILYAQQLQQGQQHLQRMNAAAQKNGRTTPQVALAAAAGGRGQSTPSPVRNSPLASNKPLAARSSPMPQIPTQHPQAIPVAGQLSQHPFAPQYNTAHLRPMIHGSQQALQAHLASINSATAAGQSQPGPVPIPAAAGAITGGAAAGLPDGQQPQLQHPQGAPLNYYPPMYNYNYMRYWQQQGGMGRGIPISAGQVGLPAHGMGMVGAAQVPGMVGVAKASGAGVQGR